MSVPECVTVGWGEGSVCFSYAAFCSSVSLVGDGEVPVSGEVFARTLKGEWNERSSAMRDRSAEEFRERERRENIIKRV